MKRVKLFFVSSALVLAIAGVAAANVNSRLVTFYLKTPTGVQTIQDDEYPCPGGSIQCVDASNNPYYYDIDLANPIKKS